MALRDATEAADAFLACALRDGASLPGLSRPAAAAVPDRARHHGVSALLAIRPATLAALPDDVAAKLHRQARDEAIWDLRHCHVLTQLFDAFADAGIQAVLLKGTALAISVYPSSALRQRGDTDILVHPDAADATRRALLASGFARALDNTVGHGADVNRQESWDRLEADGSTHSVDVHWAVMPDWSMAALFDTAEVIARSEPVSHLAPGALRIGFADAVYHACLHRGVHIKSPYWIGDDIAYEDRLIWLYDLHLLAPHLSDADWSEVVARATRHRTTDLCHDALSEAVRLLGTQVSPDILSALAAQAVDDGPSFYLTRASRGRLFLANLAAVPGLRAKFAYFRTYFFPSGLYMRAKYDAPAGTPVWKLHVRRIGDRLRRRAG